MASLKLRFALAALLLAAPTAVAQPWRNKSPPPPPAPAAAKPSCAARNALRNPGFETGWVDPALLGYTGGVGSEQWFNTEFSLYNDISTFVSEYLNTSRAGVSWRSTAVDFYNATLVAKLYGSSSAYFGAQTARRGFTAQAAAQYPQYTFAKYELVEIMQNASIADAGSFYCELNSDQPAAIYQDVATVPGSTWAWYVAHRARPPELLNTAEVRLLGRAQPEGAACRAGHPCAWPLTSGPWAWTHNAGTYVVPPNQTTTRLWITPVVWASDGSQGNWIDSVVFCPL